MGQKKNQFENGKLGSIKFCISAFHISPLLEKNIYFIEFFRGVQCKILYFLFVFLFFFVTAYLKTDFLTKCADNLNKL